MSPEYRIEMLQKLYSADFIRDVATRNNISWNEGEEDTETYNNMISAILEYLKEGNLLDLDFTEEGDIQETMEAYIALREVHKKYMVPQIKGVMEKIRLDAGGKAINSDEVLEKAYELLSQYGGEFWNNKLATLHHYTTRIRELEEQLDPGDTLPEESEENI